MPTELPELLTQSNCELDTGQIEALSSIQTVSQPQYGNRKMDSDARGVGGDRSLSRAHLLPKCLVGTLRQWLLWHLPLQPLTEAADVKMFHQLGEDAVAEQDSGEPWEIRQRQWH
jgi:hypothetical protein